MAEKRHERPSRGEKDPDLSDTEYSPRVMSMLKMLFRARRAKVTAGGRVCRGLNALLLSEQGLKATKEELGSRIYLSDNHVHHRTFSSLRAGLIQTRATSECDSLTSWRPLTDDERPFLIIEFPVPWIVSGVQTSGEPFDEKKAHVTEFLLEYSLDNETWFKVHHFKNCVFECTSTTQFPSVKGCYFKFTVEAWVEDVSLNASLFGYPSYDQQVEYLTKKHNENQIALKMCENSVENYEKLLMGEDKGHVGALYAYAGITPDESRFNASEVLAKSILQKICETKELRSPDHLKSCVEQAPMWWMELSAPFGFRSFRCSALEAVPSQSGMGAFAPDAPLRKVIDAYKSCRRVQNGNVGWLQWNDKKGLVHSKGFAFFNEKGGVVVHHTCPLGQDGHKSVVIEDGGKNFGQQFLCLKLEPKSMDVFFECLQNIYVAIVEYREQDMSRAEALTKIPDEYPNYRKIVDMIKDNKRMKRAKMGDEVVWKELYAGNMKIEVALFGQQLSARVYEQFVTKYGKGGLAVCTWNHFPDESGGSTAKNKKVTRLNGCLLVERLKIGDYAEKEANQLSRQEKDVSHVHYKFFTGISENNSVVGLGDMNLSYCNNNRSGMFFVFHHALASKCLIDMIPQEEINKFLAELKQSGGS